MVTLNKVWIVMRYDHKDYPNINIISTVCTSKTQEFWIEDHYLNTGCKNSEN